MRSVTKIWLILSIVVVVVVVGVGALWAGQRYLIYLPDRSAPAADDRVREVVLRTSDGLDLAGGLVRPAHGDRATAVLVTPGNAGHRGDRTPLALALAGAGLTVLLLEYRGFGGNPGSPSEEGLARDARAARAYLEGAGFAADRIVYFGESLGAAVATRLATEHPPAALVLRSPFVDLASAAREHYPWLPVRALLRDRFPVARQISGVTAPATVIYGGADTIVPPDQSRAVADRAAGPVRVVVLPGADHNDAALTHGPEVVAAILDAAGRAGG